MDAYPWLPKIWLSLDANPKLGAVMGWICALLAQGWWFWNGTQWDAWHAMCG